MIAGTNKHTYPDTSVVILSRDKGKSCYEEKGQATRVLDENNEVIGFNFFNVDQYLSYNVLDSGEVGLAAEDLVELNQVLTGNGFFNQLKPSKPTLVYGYVKIYEAHPGPDRLHITTVDAELDDDIKIVCDAPSIEADQKVVVTLSGALMSSGAQIWPGKLRGAPSYGIICSARELGLTHTPQKRGITVVPDNPEVGQKFEPTKRDELLASGAITL